MGWYLPGVTPQEYRRLSSLDREYLNEALDDWLDKRQNQDLLPTDGSLTGQPPHAEDKDFT